VIAPPDPKFLRVLALMRKLQQSGAVGMRVQTDQEKRQSALLTFQTSATTQEAREDSRELRELLGLDPEAGRFKLVFGPTAASNQEVAVLTRSVMHIMQTMATQVEVPAKHVEEGRVAPGWERIAEGEAGPRLIRILSAAQHPGDAFVSVEYRGHWFWIDDRDLKTKRTFAFMMMLFTLADTSEKDPLPLITIPAQ
jgi:hypothetical protein